MAAASVTEPVHCPGCGNRSLHIRRIFPAAQGAHTVDVGRCHFCDVRKCGSCGHYVQNPKHIRCPNCTKPL